MIDLYLYKVDLILNVIDGDTVDLRIDIGFRQFIKDRFRLYGIDTPEIRGSEKLKGIEASNWLKNRLASININDLYIRTFKDKKGKYGRWLAEIIEIKGDKFISINEELIHNKLAVRKLY